MRIRVKILPPLDLALGVRDKIYEVSSLTELIDNLCKESKLCLNSLRIAVEPIDVENDMVTAIAYLDKEPSTSIEITTCGDSQCIENHILSEMNMCRDGAFVVYVGVVKRVSREGENVDVLEVRIHEYSRILLEKLARYIAKMYNPSRIAIAIAIGKLKPSEKILAVSVCALTRFIAEKACEVLIDAIKVSPSVLKIERTQSRERVLGLDIELHKVISSRSN